MLRGMLRWLPVADACFVLLIQVMSCERRMLHDHRSAAEQMLELQQQIQQLQDKLAVPLVPWVSFFTIARDTLPPHNNSTVHAGYVHNAQIWLVLCSELTGKIWSIWEQARMELFTPPPMGSSRVWC